MNRHAAVFVDSAIARQSNHTLIVPAYSGYQGENDSDKENYRQANVNPVIYEKLDPQYLV